MTKVHIRGSHGTLVVDQLTGTIIEYDRDCWCGDDYDNILRIDPVSIQNDTSFDILSVAYWTRDGQYEPALTPLYEDGQWVDWRQMAVLPAPATIN